VVLTGRSGSGKTSLAISIAEALRRRAVPVAGILSPGRWESGKRSGFDIVDAASGRRARLSSRNAAMRPGAVVPFTFDPEGLQLGRAALRPEAMPARAVVFVDEVGPLELRGGGWSDALDRLADRDGPLVLVVREGLVDRVAARWLRRPPLIVRAGEVEAREMAELLAEQAVQEAASESVA
jgi:nucleoside-triphosphatase THEP1